MSQSKTDTLLANQLAVPEFRFPSLLHTNSIQAGIPRGD